MKNTITINKNAQTTVGAGLDSARGCRGITLIALIITVIVLLILAGVELNFIVGQNGILTHSETSKQQYELASAREELEMVIADIQTEIIKTEGRKATLVDLENRIDKNKYSIILSTDPIATTTAVSTNYTYATVVELEKEIEFTVDAKLIIREVELVSVKQGTAEVEISTAIKSYVGKDANNKYRVKYEITLSTMQGVKSITVESGEEKQELTIDENLTKEVSVEIGKVYTITVTMEDGKYKRKTIYDRATETIKTAEELAQFRDKVNSGLSYEGKTVELANEIDLSSVCGANIEGKQVSWTPIGTSTRLFKGTFDGNKQNIKNLYINSTSSYQGLFGVVSGNIKNLQLKNVNVKVTSTYAGALVGMSSGKIENIYTTGTINASNSYVGGIVGQANNTVEGCVNKIQITGTTSASNYYGGIVGYSNAEIIRCGNEAKIIAYSLSGGVAGYGKNVRECYNKGYIQGSNDDMGGICGTMFVSGTTIENCYNRGNVTSSGRQIAGIVGDSYKYGTTEIKLIKNCYNTGTISGSSRIGSIAGQTMYTYLRNCVWTTSNSGLGNNAGGSTTESTSKKVDSTTLQSYATTLGSAYTNDVKIKVKDETTGEEKEVWKYNDGYPILKWQLETN